MTGRAVFLALAIAALFVVTSSAFPFFEDQPDSEAEASAEIASLPMEARDDGPSYQIHGVHALNGGKPFFVDQDPVTGKVNLSAAVVPSLTSAPAEEYYYEQDEHDGIDRKDTAGTLGRPNDIGGPFKVDKTDLHDFLNLPTRYSNSASKYPLISSSYANTKVQGTGGTSTTHNGGSSSGGGIKNHKPYSSSSTQQPHYYPIRDTLQTTSEPSSTTTTTTTTTSTTPRPPPRLTTSTTLPPPPPPGRTTTTTTTEEAPSGWGLDEEYYYEDYPTSPPKQPHPSEKPILQSNSHQQSFPTISDPVTAPPSPPPKPTTTSTTTTTTTPTPTSTTMKSAPSPPKVNVLKPFSQSAVVTPSRIESTSTQTTTTMAPTQTTLKTTSAPVTQPTTKLVTSDKQKTPEKPATTTPPAPTKKPSTNSSNVLLVPEPTQSNKVVFGKVPLPTQPPEFIVPPARPNPYGSGATQPFRPLYENGPQDPNRRPEQPLVFHNLARPLPPDAGDLITGGQGGESEYVSFSFQPPSPQQLRPPAPPRFPGVEPPSANPPAPFHQPTRPPPSGFKQPTINNDRPKEPERTPNGTRTTSTPLKPESPPTAVTSRPVVFPDEKKDTVAHENNDGVKGTFTNPNIPSSNRPQFIHGSAMPVPPYRGNGQIEPQLPPHRAPGPLRPDSTIPPFRGEGPVPPFRGQPPKESPILPFRGPVQGEKMPPPYRGQPQGEKPIQPFRGPTQGGNPPFRGQLPLEESPPPYRGQPQQQGEMHHFPQRGQPQQSGEVPLLPPRGHPQQGEVPHYPQRGQPQQPGEVPQQPQRGQPQQGEVPHFPQRGQSQQPGEVPQFPPRGQPQQGEVPHFPQRGQPQQPGEVPQPPRGQPQQGEVPHFPQRGQPQQPGEVPQLPPRGQQQQGEVPHFPQRGQPQQPGEVPHLPPRGPEPQDAPQRGQGEGQPLPQRGQPQPEGQPQRVHGENQPPVKQEGEDDLSSLPTDLMPPLDPGLNRPHLVNEYPRPLWETTRPKPPHIYNGPQGLRPKLDTVPPIYGQGPPHYKLGPRIKPNPERPLPRKPEGLRDQYTEQNLPNILPQFRPNARISNGGPIDPSRTHFVGGPQRMPLMERPGAGRPHAVYMDGMPPPRPHIHPHLRGTREDDTGVLSDVQIGGEFSADLDSPPPRSVMARRTGPHIGDQNRRVTTLQMMNYQSHRHVPKPDLTGLKPPYPAPFPANEKPVDERSSVFVVYPVNSGPSRNGPDSDGGVVVGTRGPTQPLPPSNLNSGDDILGHVDLDDDGPLSLPFALNKQQKPLLNPSRERTDAPILKPHRDHPNSLTKTNPTKNEFPYTIVQPDIKPKTPPSNEKKPLIDQEAASAGDDSEINVIPYLQDYLPFATKKPKEAENYAAQWASEKMDKVEQDARIVVGSGTSAPPTNIKAVSSISRTDGSGSRSPPSRHETVIGDGLGGSEFTVGAVMHTLSAHRAPEADDKKEPESIHLAPQEPQHADATEEKLPNRESPSFQPPYQNHRLPESSVDQDNQGFQAPFQASVSVGSSALNHGWSVVNGDTTSRPGLVEKSDVSANTTATHTDGDAVTPSASVGTETSTFDIENFKPQLFSGFKPIFPEESESGQSKESSRTERRSQS